VQDAVTRKDSAALFFVIPAKAFGESRDPFCRIAFVDQWIPAFAGMTGRGVTEGVTGE